MSGSEHVHLEGAVGDVGVEGAELGGADVERDAGGAHLLLEDGCEEPCGLVAADLQG
jgi:hypothetical protein